MPAKTPLPWTVLKAREDMSASIAELDGAYTNDPMHVNDATYIVHACNAYPALVAALREIVDPNGGWRNLRVDNAKAALALLRSLGEAE